MTHGEIAFGESDPLPRFAAVMSVTEANQRGMSTLIPTLRTGGDVLIVKNSRPEAVLIPLAKYDKLRRLEEADACATYMLALGRYLAQHRAARPLAEVMANCEYGWVLSAFAPAGALRMVESAAAELLRAARHEQTMLMVTLREVAADAGSGVAIGPQQVPAIRVVTLGKWRLAFATAPDWDVPYVLEVARQDSRDCFDRMNEAASLMGGTLSRYSVVHKPDRDDPGALLDLSDVLDVAPRGPASRVRTRARAQWADDVGDGGL